MKQFLLASLCCVVVVAQTGRSGTNRDVQMKVMYKSSAKFGRPGTMQEVLFMADETSVDGKIRHFKGDVKIETDTMVIRADEVDFVLDTHYMAIQGNVRITLKAEE